MRIALVRPPVIQLRTSLSAYGAILPIGLAYVAAVLRDAGHALQVVDAAGEGIDSFRDFESPIGTLTMNGLSPEEIVARLAPGTQVLGITHMFLHEWPTVREIAERAKAAVPGLTVVVGGENATAYWSWMFAQTDAVDFCVLGEGEATMRELVARLSRGEPVAGLHGVVSCAEHRARGGSLDAAIRTGPPVRTEDLVDTAPVALPAGEADDENETAGARESGGPVLSTRDTALGAMPRPAWELFPVERYLQHADNHGVNRGRSLPMLATRGCPYRCTFCSSPAMWTTKYVTRPPQDVVDEIKHAIARWGITNVNFCDLTAIVKREWILEFGRLLQQEQLDLTWQLPTGTRSEVLDDEVLPLIFETGCRNITYAPESGSERMLKEIKKNVLIPRMLGSLRSARRAGLVTRVNIIIGHPRETWRDTRASLRFLMRAALAGCQDSAVMIFAPYPGSADFRELLAQGKVEMGPDYFYLALARSGFSSKTYNQRMSTRQLILAQYGMLLAFYATAYLSRPWRAIGALRSLFTGKENTQLDQLLRTKFGQFGKKTGKKKDAAARAEPVPVMPGVGALRTTGGEAPAFDRAQRDAAREPIRQPRPPQATPAAGRRAIAAHKRTPSGDDTNPPAGSR